MSADAADSSALDDGWWALRLSAGRHGGFFTLHLVRRTGCEDRLRGALEDGSVIRAGMGMLRLADWPSGPLDEYAMWSAWFDGTVVVSHHSAAELYGLGRLRPRFVHLSTAGGRAPSTPRLVVMRRTLHSAEVESAGTFLVTTPVRTVLDLADSGIGQNALDEVVSDAVAIHRCAGPEIRCAAETLPPRPATRLRRALSLA
jgi:hypothetical protein